LSESLSLGSRYGLSTQTMLEVLRLAPTSNAWLEAKIDGLLGGPSKTSLDLVTLRKDVMSALAAGTDRGVGMPMTAGTLSAVSAAVASGWGRRDCADLIEFFQQHMHQFGLAESERRQAIENAPVNQDIRKRGE
jgi:3-hydroxyisobutyrate dehydrogenase-like beta-hydroxyacid dehydrogenase